LPPLVVVVDESSVIKEFPNKEPGEKGGNLTRILKEYGVDKWLSLKDRRELSKKSA